MPPFVTGKVWVAAVLLAALGLRIWTVIALQDDPRIEQPVIDGMLYLQAAREIAAGTFDWQVVFFQGPLYTLLLGSLFRIASAEVISIQVLQSTLGLASGLLLYLAVRRWAGPAPALVSMILWLFYGPILEMESEVVPATLLLFLTTAALWAWPRPHDGPSALPFGILAGLLMVASGTFAILACIALLGVLLGRAPARTTGRNVRMPSRWATAAYLVAGLALAAAPLSIHQSRESGRLLLLTPNSGLNLYLGNNPAARGIYSSPPEVEIEQDFTGARSASRAAGRPLTLVESSSFWRDRALDFFREDPARGAWLLGRKALLFLTPREIPQIENFSRLAADTPPLRVAFLRFGWVLPFAILGCVMAIRNRRARMESTTDRGGKRSRRSARTTEHHDPRARESGSRRRPPPEISDMFPFLALVAAGWIATIAFFATGRFRIPIVPGFLALAAIGLVELWRARETRRSLGIGLAIVLGVAALQSLLPTYPVARADANADYLLGLRLAERGDHEGAIAIFQRALAQDPTSGEAWHGIGVSRAEQRRFEQAVEAYRHALERMPLSTWTHYNLGVCLEQMGRHEEAARAFSDAVALLPNDPNLRYRLGASLAQAGRAGEAIEQLEMALELDPRHSAAIGLLSRIRSGE